MRPGRRGLRPGRQPEASGQGSLRVALASGSGGRSPERNAR